MRRASERATRKAADAAVPPPPLKRLVIEHLDLIEITRQSKQVTDPTNVWGAVAKEIEESFGEDGVTVAILPSTLKTYFKQAKRGVLSVRVEQVKPISMLTQVHVEQRKEPIAEPVIEVAKPSTSEVAEGHRAPSAPPPSLHPRRSQQDKEAEKEAVARLLDKSNSPFLTVRSDATTNKEV